MAKIALYNMEGEKTGELEVKDEVFSTPVRKDVMHTVLLYQLASRRKGCASTKGKGEVRGGGRKPWRQKGTGRARHGSRRSPIWKGGGVVFGPHPRSYAFTLPRKVRRLALKSALSDKCQTQAILALDQLKLEEIKTKAFKNILQKLPLNGKVLVVLESRDFVVEKSAGNLPMVKVILAQNLNLHDLLKYETLLMTEKAVRTVEEVLSR